MMKFIFLILTTEFIIILGADIELEDENFIIAGFREDTPTSQLIKEIKVKSKHSQIFYESTHKKTLRYIKFLPKSNNNCDVYLSEELDAESQESPNHIFPFTISDKVSQLERTLYIEVLDVNDEIPRFEPVQTVFKIKENNDVPELIETFKVRDDDRDKENRLITFSLKATTFNVNDLFYLETYEIDGEVPAEAKLYLNISLDYEKEKYYFLDVYVQDGDDNSERRNNATKSIIIEVQDVQDSPPEFLKAPAMTHIAEDAPLGRFEYFEAVDGDRGVPNKIRYEISSISPEIGKDYFEISNTTGTLYLIKSLEDLDLQSNTMFVLSIKAIEISEEQDNVTVKITIIVDDVNNNKPTFVENCYTAEIEENSLENIPITFIDGCQNGVTINDRDLGINAKYATYLINSNDTFHMVPQRGINEAIFLVKVKNNTLLDYEIHQHLSFEMFAQETDTKEKFFSNSSIRVNIKNINDHSPVFNETTYSFSFYEHPSIGTAVGQVYATDDDLEIFGVVVYSKLYGSAETRLNLNLFSGFITIANEDAKYYFDRENISEFFLSVEAKDNNGTEPNNKAMSQIHLILLDINDNYPIFIQTLYEAILMENSPVFQKKLQLLATDKDEGENSVVQYKIVDGDRLNNFTIDKITGVISPIAPVDFEAMEPIENSNQRIFNLTVTAYDLGQPSLSTDVSVIIYVEDINDHEPVFVESIYFGVVNETVNLNNDEQFVLMVSATDLDGTSPYNEVTYQMYNGSANKFMINGEIITVIPNAQLDYDVVKNYFLTIVAVDGGFGSNQLTGTCMVNIEIKDMNNKDPYFQTKKFSVSVLEDKPVGFYISDNTNASDRDSTHHLFYSIDDYEDPQDENGNLPQDTYDYKSLFSVNSSSGFIYIHNYLDREEMEKIKLVLMVEDQYADTSYKQTATALISILIEDVNDNDPEFIFTSDFKYYFHEVYENSLKAIPVTTFRATDKDKNRTITFSFGDQEHLSAKVFNLSSKSGELKITGNPLIDRELNEWINFSVIATDNGVPSRSTAVPVYIYVVDVNDNAPNFTYFEKNVSIKEHEPIGTNLTYVYAYDPDTGDYGKVTYLLEGIAFYIHPNHGYIYVNSDIDREKTDKFVLSVVAKDDYRDGRNPESNSAQVEINVKIIDINDNPPIIHYDGECISIDEDYPVSKTFYEVDATDADEPGNNNSAIIFYLLTKEDSGNDTDYFEINKEGHLSLKKSVENQVGRYFIIIQAQDLGEIPLYCNATIHICVRDINNNPPVIRRPISNEAIPVLESTPVDSQIYQVIATDDDVDEINRKLNYTLTNTDDLADETFKINQEDGIIYLKSQLNIQKTKLYKVLLTVTDSKHVDQLYFKILIIVNDTTPYFPTSQIDIFNLTEHKIGPEFIGVIKKATFQDEEYISQFYWICYFIIDGDDENDKKFNLDKFNGQLTLQPQKEIDRETKAFYNLVISAVAIGNSECILDFFEEVISASEDKSKHNVRINIDDINDQPPVFSKKLYTAGIDVTASYNTIVPVNLKITDKDENHNAINYFYIIDDIEFTSADNKNQKPSQSNEPVFKVDKYNGIVQVNVVFEPHISGYFHFNVIANDSTLSYLNDTAHVSIYVVNSDQKFIITCRVSPSVIESIREKLISILSNITGGATINIDEIKSNNLQSSRTDIILHAIKDGKIMDAATVLNMIDKSDNLIYELNALLQIHSTGLNKIPDPPVTITWQALAIGLTASLGLFVLLIFSICLAQRSWYKRKLKVSQIKITDIDMDKDQLIVPGTNQYAGSGTNPIWQENGFNNMWLHGEDNNSLRSGNESLDDNVVLSGNDLNQKQSNFTIYKPQNNINYKPPNYEDSESSYKQLNKRFSSDL